MCIVCLEERRIVGSSAENKSKFVVFSVGFEADEWLWCVEFLSGHTGLARGHGPGHLANTDHFVVRMDRLWTRNEIRQSGRYVHHATGHGYQQRRGILFEQMLPAW